MLKQSFKQNLFINKVKKTIESNHLLECGDHILAGVSGGPDSMCLLDLLQRLSKQQNYFIEVAHVNHSLRGEPSDSDQRFVAAYCEKNNLVFHTDTIDVNGFSKAHSIGVEEAARFVRYRFFRKCTGNRAMKIAVAHHQQDQVETILLNLIRGCGLDGLKGMDYCTGDVIRPLLDCTKEEIEAYLSFYQIPYCIDQTNQQSYVDRNRVRLELLPDFQQLFGRDVSPSILKTRSLCLQDAVYLDNVSKIEFQSLLHGDFLPCDALNLLDPAILSRVVRCLFEKVKGDKQNLSQIQTDTILRIVKKKKEGSVIHLSDGFCAVITRQELHFMKQSDWNEDIRQKKEIREKERNIHIPLIIPAKRYEEEIKMVICTKLIENPEEVDYNAIARSFPYEKAKGCVWRYRKEGDWIRPNRGSGKKPLKKYFIDKKIPRDQRDHALLLAQGSEILWIPELEGNRIRKPSFSEQEPTLSSGRELAEYVYIKLEHRS